MVMSARGYQYLKDPQKRDGTGGINHPASAQTLVLAAVFCQAFERSASGLHERPSGVTKMPPRHWGLSKKSGSFHENLSICRSAFCISKLVALPLGAL
jgi:hypothetical protein